jgi:hypothetical protein
MAAAYTELALLDASKWAGSAQFKCQKREPLPPVVREWWNFGDTESGARS